MWMQRPERYSPSVTGMVYIPDRQHMVFAKGMSQMRHMGPKPCIYVTFENLGDRTVYASFFALEGGPSPVSYGDWGIVPDEIKQRFVI